MAARGRAAAAAVLFLAVSALAGCAPAQQSATPAGTPQIIDSVAYAPAQPKGSEGHLLDIYLPAKRERPLPLIISGGGRLLPAD